MTGIGGSTYSIFLVVCDLGLFQLTSLIYLLASTCNEHVVLEYVCLRVFRPLEIQHKSALLSDHSLDFNFFCHVCPINKVTYVDEKIIEKKLQNYTGIDYFTYLIT